MTITKPTIGIVGTGPIGLGSAALLSKHGLTSMIWSPSRNFQPGTYKGIEMTSSGAIDKAFFPEFAHSAKELVQNCKVILIAVPANAHKDVFDQIAEYLRADHVIIISSHAPFGSQYLQSRLLPHDIEPLIIAWGTTIVSGRKNTATSVHINTVRDRVDMATLPVNRANEGLQLCQQLFGDHFKLHDNMMVIALSNLNPQNHLGIALCNLTRMEKGEIWQQAANITPAVGRLLEQLDKERLAIAEALDLKVRNIYEHFSLSFHVAYASVSDMSEEMVRNGHSGCGPASLDTRYVFEDVPYGLVPTAWLGQQVGRPAILHEAGILMFNALYGQDFYSENTLMAALDLEVLSKTELQNFPKH